MRVKKMNEKKKKKYGWCTSYMCSSMLTSDRYFRKAQKIFFEKDSKKKISISHMLEGN